MLERNDAATPPRNSSYIEWLRYLVQSSHPDDPALSFIAQNYSYALRHDGLKTAQEEALKPYLAYARQYLDDRGFDYEQE